MEAIVTLIAAFGALSYMFLRVFTRVFELQDYQSALLVRRGRVVRELGPGVHRIWGRRARVEAHDLRSQRMHLGTQEVATKDRVPVKVNAVVVYRITDARRVRSVAADAWSELYRFAQLSLRDAIEGFELDELSERRAEIAKRVESGVRADAERLGYEVESFAVLDVILRSELKQAMGEVVKARAEGRAKLERARGESAALRNLANAARLLKENDALYQLRLLETAQAAATSQSNSLVLGLREGLDLKPSTNGRAH